LKQKKNNLNVIISILITSSFLLILFPTNLAANNMEVIGFDKGPSYTSVVPYKKATLIQHDKDTIIDDYAYLAAIPTTVFYDNGKLHSNPLLFYEDEYKYKKDEERTLNPRQGLDYFMDDWMSYCNDKMDQMTTINIPEEKIRQWNAKENINIDSNNPFEIASSLALHDWSYSDDVVIAVIEESFENTNEITENLISGSISKKDIGHQKFEVEQPVIGTGGTYTSFDIKDRQYKYAVAKLTWPNRIDLDIQIYDSQLGMVDNAAHAYNAEDPNLEVVGSFIHNYGKWQISVTAVPKKGIYQDDTIDNDYKFFDLENLKELAQTIKNTGKVDVWLYPGTIVELEKTPFGCRNAEFKLKWSNPKNKLGFSLHGPDGTEICSSLSKDEIATGIVENDKAEESINVKMLGECSEGENYFVCVFSLDNIEISTDFELEYSWEQGFSEKEADAMVSATNGAVLASSMNVPLLYVSPSYLSNYTKDTLYELGVENIYLLNIGNHLKNDILDELKNIANIKKKFQEPIQIYDNIKELTGNTGDIIFTTIDPWSYWKVAELKPAGEYEGARFVGPATYIAAHHGSPVIIVDKHPHLSQAVCYPTDFWRRNSNNRGFIVPSAGSMILSGRKVYDFLEKYNLGKLEEGLAISQDQETIITVAGQYDIGLPWDRAFTGAALPGRFWGSPVDTSYVICRNVFYPVLIYENPAMYEENAIRTNGSASKIQRIGGRLKEPIGVTLVTTKKSQEEEFRYPILQTYNTFGYKFNEKAYKNWDFRYERADGIIPYVTHSSDPIDDGIAPGKSGAYHPDLSETEVIPFYASRAGYGSVFSTEGTAVASNLNRGVIIWVLKGHGWHKNSGSISMWDPDNPYAYEENPWRVYEPILLQPGNLREFIRFIIYGLTGQKPTKLTDGLIKFHLLSEIGSTENPDVATINPQLYLINKFAKEILPIDLWGANGIMIYRDRIKRPFYYRFVKNLPLINIYQGDGKVIISPQSGHQPMTSVTGLIFDEALENLHSCGLNTGACLPACTYMHMAWMRHGMVYQIIDPWTTTDWNGIWNQMIIKQLAMGDTIGEAYEKGMRACGPELLVGQFWWDIWENVCYFGDPELRVFVPSTEYSDENYWEEEDIVPFSYEEELNIDGHMPFGATEHPNKKEPKTFANQYLFLILIAIIVIILIIAIASINKKKKQD